MTESEEAQEPQTCTNLEKAPPPFGRGLIQRQQDSNTTEWVSLFQDQKTINNT